METKKQKPLLNLMLDIETLGTKPGCVILSVAYESFCLDSKQTPAYHVEDAVYIDIFSSLLEGFTIDQGTVGWWGSDKVSDESRQAMFEGLNDGARTVNKAMVDIYNYLTALHEAYDLRIYGRGVSTFDLPILDHAMRTVIGPDYKTPWSYWSPRDSRSIFDFCKQCGMSVPPITTAHDALADCKKQITEMQQAYYHIHK